MIEEQMLNTPRQPHLHKADVSGSTDFNTRKLFFSGHRWILNLGAEWAGIPTIWNCEIEPFQRAVLKQRFKNTEQYEDIRNLQTPQKSISLVEVSPAKTFQVQEVEQELTEKKIRIMG